MLICTTNDKIFEGFDCYLLQVSCQLMHASKLININSIDMTNARN